MCYYHCLQGLEAQAEANLDAAQALEPSKLHIIPCLRANRSTRIIPQMHFTIYNLISVINIAAVSTCTGLFTSSEMIYFKINFDK